MWAKKRNSRHPSSGFFSGLSRPARLAGPVVPNAPSVPHHAPPSPPGAADVGGGRGVAAADAAPVAVAHQADAGVPETAAAKMSTTARYLPSTYFERKIAKLRVEDESKRNETPHAVCNSTSQEGSQRVHPNREKKPKYTTTTHSSESHSQVSQIYIPNCS